ncbi:MAG TPA: hypothetical protein ENK50_02645 [Sedimenticola sp.]|nr:hypothetical protein [Sedimenticola sp.]
MQLSSLTLMTLGELLLVTSVATLLMLILAVVRKRRDRSAAGDLITRIKADETRRESETRAFLEQNLGIGGEALEPLVKRIGREEKRFYQTLINLYLKRDAGALANLQEAYEEATAPYRSLDIEKGTDGGDIVPATLDPAAGEEAAEVARLREQNEQLSEELRITMDTMGRMLSEYSSMYAGGEGEGLDKEKMLEMFRSDAVKEHERNKAASGEAVVPASPASEEDDILPVSGDSELLDAVAEVAQNNPLGGSAVADLQAKMEGLDAAIMAPDKSGDDDDLVAVTAESSAEDSETADEIDETELIDLDTVLEQRI